MQRRESTFVYKECGRGRPLSHRRLVQWSGRRRSMDGFGWVRLAVLAPRCSRPARPTLFLHGPPRRRHVLACRHRARPRLRAKRQEELQPSSTLLSITIFEFELSLSTQDMYQVSYFRSIILKLKLSVVAPAAQQ